MNRQIEILAPAGSYEGMKAAMNAGCDAVYIGGSSFGARAYANNLSEDILLGAIDEAHVRNKKLYLTVNTLLKEKERTKDLYRFLEKFYLRGLDAVIVQDVGVLHFIHEHFPELPIHASTQTTLTMAQGANLLKDYGVTRLVTARELSLKEIKNIRENTDLEIETFVHGALCYCYSGQCLMSSMIGGRSGNRGRCAQPCRMPYQLYSGNKKISSDQEKYLLSPKDINTLAMIPELIDAGIDSFKIEGRMKRPEYAAAVSSMYRKYVDLYFESGKDHYNNYIQSEAFKKDMTLLQDVYSRGGFSEGYGKTYNGKNMMSLYRPNHSGVYVGEVTAIKGIGVTIALIEDVNAQDILEIRHNEEEGYEFTVKDSHSLGDTLSTNVGRRQDTGENKNKDKREQRFNNPIVHISDKVYRTKNNKLLEQLEADYLAKDQRLGIMGSLTAKSGERLTLTVSYQDSSVTVYQDIVQDALKQPMTKEKLSAPIEKTGDTFYYFDSLIVDMGDNIFVPVAWLNEIRREAIVCLQEEVAKKYRRNSEAFAGDMKESAVVTTDSTIEDTTVEYSTVEDTTAEDTTAEDTTAEDTIAKDKITTGIKASGKTEAPGICVSVQTVEQFEQVLQYAEINSIYADYDMFDHAGIPDMADKAVAANKEFYLALPHICRLTEYTRLKKDLLEIIDNKAIQGFIIKNFEEIALLASLRSNEMHKKLILNYNMYTYNKEAKSFFGELGITHYCSPVELNYQELRSLGIQDSDLIVYGYQPVMISAQCLFESTVGCKKCKQGNSGNLIDRLGKSFYVQTNCNGCYNTIYNGQPLSLLKQQEEITVLSPRNIRLDFTKETNEEMQNIIAAFIAVFRYKERSKTELADYTTGHFKRGVE